MLSREHGIAEYDYRRGQIVPDRLTQSAHAHYLRYAERMLRIYREGVGRTRRELHQAVHKVFSGEPECPVRRVDAFCKLLDDAGKYHKDRRGEAAKLRQTVFRRAAARHPLVQQADGLFEHGEQKTKQEIAAELGKSWPEIESELFADIIEFQRLESFAGYSDAAALLARYNVAQAQVALYDAVELVVRASEDFKTILRYAKLARLMHTIQQLPGGLYQIRFDGPTSVLRHTRRYGVAMARFLPSLLSCRGWTMHARVRTRRSGWMLSYRLSPEDGLRSPRPAPEEFDSQLEATFADRWGTEPREGWTLHRESTVLHREQKVFVPDFEFLHTDGCCVLMEIIGFWTPEYLEAKQQTLMLFKDHPILLAVAHQVHDKFPASQCPMIIYKTAPKIGEVLRHLEQLRDER